MMVISEPSLWTLEASRSCNKSKRQQVVMLKSLLKTLTRSFLLNLFISITPNMPHSLWSLPKTNHKILNVSNLRKVVKLPCSSFRKFTIISILALLKKVFSHLFFPNEAFLNHRVCLFLQFHWSNYLLINTWCFFLLKFLSKYLLLLLLLIHSS